MTLYSRLHVCYFLVLLLLVLLLFILFLLQCTYVCICIISFLLFLHLDVSQSSWSDNFFSSKCLTGSPAHASALNCLRIGTFCSSIGLVVKIVYFFINICLQLSECSYSLSIVCFIVDIYFFFAHIFLWSKLVLTTFIFLLPLVSSVSFDLRSIFW